MWQRYQRQMMVPGFGPDQQQRLASAKVLVVGMGGLGCPAATYLARSGIGSMTLVDGDVVAESNLHRQTLFANQDLGSFKVVVAAHQLRLHNPNMVIETICEHLSQANARSLVDDHDIVIDCMDNIVSRMLLSDTCVEQKVPLVYGSVYQLEGRVGVFCGAASPCYRCFHPEDLAGDTCTSCADSGVLATLPGVIGIMQAHEAIKVLTGIGEPLWGQLFLLNMSDMVPFKLRVGFASACCGERRQLLVGSATSRRVNQDGDSADQWELQPATILLDESSWQFLDARTADEFAAGAIRGSQLFEATGEAFLDRVEPDRPIVVYCRSGKRSRVLAATLRCARPTQKVYSMAGGMTQWLESGGQVRVNPQF